MVSTENATIKHRISFDTNSVFTEDDAVLKVLRLYKSSINNADAEAGSHIWMSSPEISMIHPCGHEKGWYQIKSNVYGKFKRNYIFRNLSSQNEKITILGDFALLEFEWDFEALMKSDNDANTVEWGCWNNHSIAPSERNRIVKSKGLESMFLRKVGYEWKIVHIHYSTTPAADSHSAH